MQDTILLQYLSKKMHTHAYKLTIDGEITFSCCKVLALDRKSTRLNSSHLGISYAVFCWTFYWNHRHREFLVYDPSGKKIFTASLQATMLFILSVLSVLPLLFI